MTYYVQAVLLTGIEALSCGIFCETFLEKRQLVKKQLKYVFPFLLFAGFIVISLLHDISYFLKAFVVIAWIVLIMAMQYQNSLLKICLVSTGYYGLVLCIDRIMLIVIDHASDTGATVLFQEPVKGTIVALLCKMILFLIIIFLHKQFRTSGDLNVIADKEWLRFLLFPVVTIICMMVFAMEGEGSMAVFITSFALVFSNFLMFYIMRDVVAREQRIREIQVSRERIKNQMDMYRYMETVYDGQQKKVHEFKNQIGCLNGLVKNKNYEKLEEYLGKLTDNWIEETDYINTNHAIVNSIINQKYKYAKSKGIPILFAVNDLGELPIGEEDIVILLANLLDNAIEACQKVAERDKIIKFRFLMEGNKITISIRNPVQEAVKVTEGRLETTKKNAKEHGIGMLNIQKVVEQYGGENVWSCRDGYFTQSIIFYCIK